MAEGAVPTGDIQTPQTTQPDINVIAKRPAARRDPLTQLGISPDLIQKYQDSADSAELARNQAQQVIKNNSQRRDEIMAQEIPHPAPPQIQDLPAPPETPKTNPLRVFGQFLPVLAVLGGAASRYSATAAMDAATAAVNAAKANDDEALKKADEQWNRQMDYIIKSNSNRLEQYRAVLEDRNMSIQDRQAQLSVFAAQNQDQVLLANLAFGDLAAVANMITTQANALSQIKDNYYKSMDLQLKQYEALTKAANAKAPMVGGAEQRGRIALSFPNIVESLNSMKAIEDKDKSNPLNEQWGAAAVSGLSNTPILGNAIGAVSGPAARAIGGQKYQDYTTSMRVFENAVLPAFAGSAVTLSEAQRFLQANMPLVGDSYETLQHKQMARERMANGAAIVIGATPPYPNAGYWSPSTGLVDKAADTGQQGATGAAALTDLGGFNAAQYGGKTITDTDTGKDYYSDGEHWIEK